MRRSICFVLVLALCLSLGGCMIFDKKQQPTEPADSAPTDELGDIASPTGDPSGGKNSPVWRYQQICDCLNAYAPGDSVRIYDFDTNQDYWGQDALRYCYQQLSSLTEVDALTDGSMPSRQTLLSGFGVATDRLLQESYVYSDNLGNVNKGVRNYWNYDTQGRLSGIEEARDIPGWEDKYLASGRAEFFYDDTDKPSRIHFTHFSGSIFSVITCSYNDQGQKIGETLRDNYMEVHYTYTYNADGTLSREEWVRNERRYWITYTYEDGLLKEKVWHEAVEREADPYEVDTTVYTYDSKGHLAGAVKTCVYHGEPRYVYRYTYVCDDRGRIIQKTVIPQRENSTENTVYTYTYGDYYVYSPAT